MKLINWFWKKQSVFTLFSSHNFKLQTEICFCSVSLEGIAQSVRFFHGDSHQGNEASEGTTVDWVWPGMLCDVQAGKDDNNTDRLR